MRIDIELDISHGSEARRFARLFRYMSFESCRSYASSDEEALKFLDGIEKILSEVKKNFGEENA
jgi:hypothetical protein